MRTLLLRFAEAKKHAWSPVLRETFDIVPRAQVHTHMDTAANLHLFHSLFHFFKKMLVVSHCEHCGPKLGCPLHPCSPLCSQHLLDPALQAPRLGVGDAVTSLPVSCPRGASWPLQEEQVWVSLAKRH